MKHDQKQCLSFKNYQITSVIDVPVNAQGQVLDAYHPDFKKEDWEFVAAWYLPLLFLYLLKRFG